MYRKFQRKKNNQIEKIEYKKILIASFFFFFGGGGGGLGWLLGSVTEFYLLFRILYFVSYYLGYRIQYNKNTSTKRATRRGGKGSVFLVRKGNRKQITWGDVKLANFLCHPPPPPFCLSPFHPPHPLSLSLSPLVVNAGPHPPNTTLRYPSPNPVANFAEALCRVYPS